jgi:hypothetical protein
LKYLDTIKGILEPKLDKHFLFEAIPGRRYYSLCNLGNGVWHLFETNTGWTEGWNPDLNLMLPVGTVGELLYISVQGPRRDWEPDPKTSE